jgi:hypothetical protein
MLTIFFEEAHRRRGYQYKDVVANDIDKAYVDGQQPELNGDDAHVDRLNGNEDLPSVLESVKPILQGERGTHWDNLVAVAEQAGHGKGDGGGRTDESLLLIWEPVLPSA